MARKVTLIDDIDGIAIDDGGGTIRFSIEGADFEIDLSAAHAGELRVCSDARLRCPPLTRSDAYPIRDGLEQRPAAAEGDPRTGGGERT